MSNQMELEEAIQTLKDFAKYGRYYSNNTEHHMKTAINTVLNHLTRQEKIIKLMVNWINDHEDPFEGCHENGKCENELIPCEECIKQYFEKKTEESDKNV